MNLKVCLSLLIGFSFFSVGQPVFVPEITYARYIFDDVGNPIVNASVLVVYYVDKWNPVS